MGTTREQAIEAYERIGTVKGTARELGLAPSTIRGHLQRAGVLKPQLLPILEPESDATLKRTSTLVDREGNIKQQWIISERDKEDQLSALKNSLDAILKPIKGKYKPKKTPAKARYNKNIQPWIILGDPHFGLMSWHIETGNSFDSDIAERVTSSAVNELIDKTEPAESCVIASTGDTFHADNAKPLTPASGNVLDIDSRFMRVFWITIRTFKHCVEAALAKHKYVHLVIVPGNHDPTMGHMLSAALHQYYCSEKRVTVDVDPTVRRYVRFGKNLVGVTHGDKQARKLLPGIMAEERKEDWGATDFRFWFLGHIHHLVREDIGRVQLEHMRTLAEPDAWHSEKGYISIKDSRCIVLHKEFGEYARYTVSKIELDGAK